MLNRLWLAFFLIAFVAALAQWLGAGNAGVFAAMVQSLFDMAKLAVEVMIVLFGTLTLWLGLLRIAERAGLIELLARALGPLFARLMPEVPRGHPAIGLITLNFAANALGMDNAATPIGLRAMRELQALNPLPETASNAGTHSFQSSLFSFPLTSPSSAAPASIIICAQELCASMWIVEFVKRTITGHMKTPSPNSRLGQR